MLGRLWRRLVSPVKVDEAAFEAERQILAASTHSIVLRLDPKKMTNADLEIRNEIDRALKSVSPSIPFVDDGYGFGRDSDVMLLSYATSEPDRLVQALAKLLDEDVFLGNRLGPAALVGLAPRDTSAEAGHEFDSHRVVYPASEAGKPFRE